MTCSTFDCTYHYIPRPRDVNPSIKINPRTEGGEAPALECPEEIIYSRSMANVTVISLGGSLIAPAPAARDAGGSPLTGAAANAGSASAGAGTTTTAGSASPGPAASRVDASFLVGFRKCAVEHLARDEKRKLIMVCGGGSLARDYQNAYREVVGSAPNDELDWIGIAATRVNGELVRRIFRQWCLEDLVTDPTAVAVFAGRVMVAAGWKPGFSTDYDAVVLAQRFSADMVVNLSNVARVYSDDPRKNPAAKPLDKVSWSEFKKIVGGEWVPGRNAPFDPVAARAAEEAHIRVIVAEGRDLENLTAILEGKSYIGTTIGPE